MSVDRPLRIVHVTTWTYPDKFGGAERVVHGIAKAQAALGHHVTILTGNHGGLAERERLDGFDVVRYPLDRGRRGLAFFLDVHHAVLDALPALVRDADVVHAHQPASGIAAIVSDSPFQNRLRVWSFYAPWSAEREAEAPTRRSLAGLGDRMRAALTRRNDRRLLEKADVVVALSEFSRCQIAEFTPSRAFGVSIVPPGVDPRFAPGDRETARRRLDLVPPKDTLQLVTVRRLVKRMGLDDLVRAIARLTELGRLGADGDRGPRGSQVVLAIAGEGPERGALESLAARLGVADRVRFLGRVADDALPDLYRAADLFVLPTRSLEGFGMVTAEALACGAPVLATDVGATPELFARFCRVLRPVRAGADSLALGVLEFVAARAAWEADAIAASQRVRAELTWESCARALIAVYSSRLPRPNR